MNTRAEAEDYYSILGVSPTADQKEIRKAYLKLSLQHHPDKNPDNPAAAQAAFVRIGQAYQVLSDPTQRAAYDRHLRTSAAAGAGAAPFASSGSSVPGGSGGAYYSSDFTPNSGGNSSSSHGYAPTYNTQQSQQQQYESYREAFDATMAGLSDNELRDVMGAAAMLGSVVGSIMGSRMFKDHPLLREVGSVVGSLVASQAASAVVQTAHSKSVQRAAIAQDRRERIARGEPVETNEQRSSQQQHSGNTLLSELGKTLQHAAAEFLSQKASSSSAPSRH